MPIIPFEGHFPRIHPTAFIAPNAIVLGMVEIGEHSSVWYGCVLRGDLEPIIIGCRTNIQDGSVLHTGLNEPCLVGDDVTVGHMALVHGCTVGNGCLVGMHSTVLNRAVIGDESIIGANALVAEGKIIPARSMVLGVPGKIVRTLEESDLAMARIYCGRYVENGRRHKRALEEWAKTQA